MFKDIHSGRLNPLELERANNIYSATADVMEKALYKGFGKNMTTIEFGTPDYKLLSELRENVYLFSGAKTFQQVREMTDALIGSDDQILPFNKFRDAAEEIYTKFNGGDMEGEVKPGWIDAEYNTALASAQSARKWDEIERKKDIFPYLLYSTTGGENVCEICGPMDGMMLPVDHPMWDSFMPPNHFGCFCLVHQVEKEEGQADETSSDDVERISTNADDKMQPLFKYNPGKDKVVFQDRGPGKHPYFDVENKYKPLARENFGFDIPEPAPLHGFPVTKSIKDAEEVSSDWVKSLNKYEKSVLKQSTGNAHIAINKFLRQGNNISPELKEDITALKNILANGPKFESETYRGVRLFSSHEYNSFAANLKEGGLMSDKGFMSSSLDKAAMKDFSMGGSYSVEMVLKSKNGVYIAPGSLLPAEKEILFNANSKFKITKLEEAKELRRGVTVKVLRIEAKEL